MRSLLLIVVLWAAGFTHSKITCALFGSALCTIDCGRIFFLGGEEKWMDFEWKQHSHISTEHVVSQFLTFWTPFMQWSEMYDMDLLFLIHLQIQSSVTSSLHGLRFFVSCSYFRWSDVFLHGSTVVKFTPFEDFFFQLYATFAKNGRKSKLFSTYLVICKLSLNV